MTLAELLRRARETLPTEGMTPESLLEWRTTVFAIRHSQLDGARGAELAEALTTIIGSTIRLLQGDEEPMVDLQDHVWRFSRLKGNSTDEAAAAAGEIQRRLLLLGTPQRRVFIADLYRVIMAAIFDLLCTAVA